MTTRFSINKPARTNIILPPHVEDLNFEFSLTTVINKKMFFIVGLSLFKFSWNKSFIQNTFAIHVVGRMGGIGMNVYFRC